LQSSIRFVQSFASEGETMLTGTRLAALGAGALLLAAIVSAAPAPTMTPADPLTDAEKAGVQRLHRNAVEIFIDRPGFGIRRMPLPVEDLITAPKSSSPKEGDKKAPELPPAKPAEPHFAVKDTVDQWGLGRIPTDDKKEQWKVGKIQLVGLVKNPKPVVYVTEKMPDMKEAKDVPTRELDTFETAALEKLRGGENLFAEKRGKEIRVVGPIYAGARCVKCHEQKGQLLGAFSYTLERVPADPEKDTKDRGPRLP
jgi:hypothetical protein